MEKKRRTERNRIYNEIRTLKSCISRNEQTLLRGQSFDNESMCGMDRNTKLKDANNGYAQDICNLEVRLKTLDMGELDGEIQLQYKKSQPSKRRPQPVKKVEYKFSYHII